MSERPRRGLGRGLGSLIPTGPQHEEPAVPAYGAAPAPSSAPQDDAAASVPRPGAAAGDRAGVVVDGSEPDGAEPDYTGPDYTGPDYAGPDGTGRGGVDGAWFAEIPVDQVSPNPRQPREVFDEEAMAELVHSIKEIGLLQPVVVRPDGDRYELIMGERRWRATREAGLATIPAIVRETDDTAMLRDALLENLHRSQLNPLEEAAAYQQLLDDFACTHDELASRIGRSRPQISNTLRLLKLSPAVQRRVAAGVLSAGHARALLGVDDPAAQDRLAGRVVSEGISVRGLEELVAVGETGADDEEPRVRPRRPSAPGLEELNDRLSDRLDTRVKVTLGKSKGRIAIEFASLADLERIVGIIDPRNRSDRPI
ncbi:MAG TPA: ParB/RepB/Spo0J family partition protein [Marmoricola sp.]|nr:ParB/RepB/Spo0J family partition protein [Marmoricola sp.]